MSGNPFTRLEDIRRGRLMAALEAAERLGRDEGLYGVADCAASGLMAAMVGNLVGAAERGADVAEYIAELIELEEYDAKGAEYEVGLELYRASRAVLAAAEARS